MTKNNIWEKPVSHGEILKNIWKHLDLGVLQRRHPFHQPVFGTICDNAPDLRMVVLRRFWRRPPRLAFHAHNGSPKINQIKANPNVYWLFYHPEEKLQVRIKGLATFTKTTNSPKNNGFQPNFSRAAATSAKPRRAKAKNRPPACPTI
jgi:pyridoxine/pyridoxamine 5'-phosphate oxidase